MMNLTFHALQSLSYEAATATFMKPESLLLPASPILSRHESKDTLKLPLIPIVKFKTEKHPRTKLHDGKLSSLPML